MFNSILTVLFALSTSVAFYIVFTIAKMKFRYFRLKNQLPFAPTESNAILSFFAGNGAQILNDPVVFAKWKKSLKTDIFGYNLGFTPTVAVFDKEFTTLIGTSKHTIEFEKTETLRHLLRFLSSGIILQEGSTHAQIRKELLPVFNMSNIEKMYPEFLKGTKKFISKLKRVDPHNYQIVNDLQSATLDIISKVAFDYDMNSLDGESKVSKAFESLLIVVEFDVFMLLELAFPLFPKVFECVKFETKKNIKIVQDCIHDVIKKRLNDTTEKDDLLAKCLLATKHSSDKDKLEDLGHQLTTFMAAGHETTSSALSWVLYELAKHPEMQSKLRREIIATCGKQDPTWDQITSMPYLDMVCHEILRLYTPVSMILRQNTKPFTFKGIYYPAGTNFTIPIQDKHLDPDLFENPHAFIPERWETLKIDSFISLPFWTGARGCIGKNLAIAEFKTILAVLLQSVAFDLNGLNVDPFRVIRITQKPKQLSVNLTFE